MCIRDRGGGVVGEVELGDGVPDPHAPPCLPPIPPSLSVHVGLGRIVCGKGLGAREEEGGGGWAWGGGIVHGNSVQQRIARGR
eukprot:2788074-Rhodomonas_salina.1